MTKEELISNAVRMAQVGGEYMPTDPQILTELESRLDKGQNPSTLALQKLAAVSFVKGCRYGTLHPWVSVSERLPGEGEKVLAYYPIDGGIITQITRGHVDMFTTLDNNGLPMVIKAREHNPLDTYKVRATYWMRIPCPDD